MDPFAFSKYWKPFREDFSKRIESLPFHDNYKDLLINTEIMAYFARSYTVYEITCGSIGHPGGSFSEAEIISVLYNYILRYNPKVPLWKMRDVFYLSKGHACPLLYSVLAMVGYFPLSYLKGYGTWGSYLESHPDRERTPGIEISTGSLGQVPGVAVGRALALKKQGPDHNNRLIFTLVGDGECQEGSVWEAFMAAGNYRLDNLIFIIDYNKVQAKGFVQDDMGIEPLADKLKAFNFDTYPVKNGHNVQELIDLFTVLPQVRRGKPIGVIVNTIKGKKVEECQFNPNWHTSPPRNMEMAREWLIEMWHKDGKRLGIPVDFPESLASAIEIQGPIHREVTDEMIDVMA